MKRFASTLGVVSLATFFSTSAAFAGELPYQSSAPSAPAAQPASADPAQSLGRETVPDRFVQPAALRTLEPPAAAAVTSSEAVTNYVGAAPNPSITSGARR